MKYNVFKKLNPTRIALYLTLAICLAAPTSGCQSITKRVDRLLERDEYNAALQVLESAEAGITVGPKASEEALLARDKYQNAVETKFLQDSQHVFDSGLSRKALSITDDASRLCPWSENVSTHKQRYSTVVARIDKATADGNFVLKSQSTRSTLVPPLKNFTMLLTNLEDSKEAKDTLSKLQSRLAYSIGSEIAGLSNGDAQRLWAAVGDATLIGLDLDELSELNSHSESVASLLEEKRHSVSSSLFSLAQGLDNQWSPNAELIFTGLSNSARQWIINPSSYELLSEQFDFHMAESIASLYADLPESTWPKAINSSLASNKASALATDPSAAALAWLYLQWGSEFGNHAEISPELRALVDAALGSRNEREIRVSIHCAPEIDPSVQSMLKATVFSQIQSEFSHGTDWLWVSSKTKDADLLISFNSAEFFIPSLSELPPTSSRYLSHYQNVPNPEKARLEAALDSARWDVDRAESNYRMSVSSHNINPTQWSLNSVNLAKSTYSLKVSQYNSLVNRFNRTPSTISEPVVLPYTFYAGNVEFGFKATGDLILADHNTPFALRSIVTDYVRTGSRIDDTDPENRISDPLEISIDVDSVLSHYFNVIADWSDVLAHEILYIDVDTRTSLSESDQRALNWISHPGGVEAANSLEADMPSWISDLCRGFQLQSTWSPPPQLVLTPRPSTLDLANLQTETLNALVKVVSEDSELSQLGHGSGTLIGPAGLVLTCAHVLNGPITSVWLDDGTGEYQRHIAEVVYTDEKNDVALIRAKSIQNSTWMEVSFEESARGSDVLVAGFPSAGTAGVANAAITEGTIATPLGDEYGSPRVVADVTIASGSSGGPMISRSTGKIIGVVTAVAKAEFTSERASSGNLCLAAPSLCLKDWLGLAEK